jgi:hypothetical protein
MKQLLLSVCLLAGLSAWAQKQGIAINYKPGLTWFGPQTQTFQEASFESAKGSTTFHSAVDIVYQYRVMPKVWLSAGVQYSMQGQSVAFTSAMANRTYTMQLNYLRIPVTVGYHFITRPTYALGFYTGINLGFAVTRKDNYQEVILEKILLPKAETRYNSKDWAISLGITYRKNISKTFFANAGVEYLLGLTNTLSEKPQFGVLQQFGHSRQSRLAGNFGLGVWLGK